jgi:maltooligosyltrehalose trehalohydrolase
MLFQGAEFGSSRPFLYFADFQGELGEAVNDGRREFLSQFPELANGAAIPRPNDPETFARSKLDWREAETNVHVVALHRDLIGLRARDSVFREQQPRCLDGAVIAPEAFLMRFFGKNGDDRLLFVNYGRDLNVEAIAEPLLAPPSGRGWRILWSSEDAKYGGGGIAPFETGNRAAHSRSRRRGAGARGSYRIRLNGVLLRPRMQRGAGCFLPEPS